MLQEPAHDGVEVRRAVRQIGVVIVEAGEQSGTMHQAWEAIRLDRPLFLLKSVADDAALTWPAKVIEYGAQVLSDDSLQPLIDNLPMATAFDKVAAAF